MHHITNSIYTYTRAHVPFTYIAILLTITNNQPKYLPPRTILLLLTHTCMYMYSAKALLHDTPLNERN